MLKADYIYKLFWHIAKILAILRGEKKNCVHWVIDPGI